MLYRLRSARLLLEPLEYTLLFRWFIGLALDAPVWDGPVFTKNRDRLLAGEVATAFFEQGLAQAKAHRLLSDDQFTVEGPLSEAWAGPNSFKQVAQPTVPPDDPATRPSIFAKLCFLGHGRMENRHGRVVRTRVTPATGTAEREAALALVDAPPRTRRITLGGDKNDDTADFIAALRTRRTL